MNSLLQIAWNNRLLESFLVVAVTAALLSTAALLVSRRFASRAPLRHLVLSSALFGCMLAPILAMICFAADVSLLSVSVAKPTGSRLPAPAQSSFMAIPHATLQQVPGIDPASPPPQWQHVRVSDTASITFLPTSTNLSVPAAIPQRKSITPSDLSGSGSRSTSGSLAQPLTLAWLAGTSVMLFLLAWNCGQVLRLRWRSWPVEDPRLLELRDEITDVLGMNQAPLLLASDRATTPLAIGLGKPAVLLPESLLSAISANEMRDVLLHEAAHLQRGDQHFVLLQSLAAALYWPIVPLHLLSRDLKHAREEICDNVVLASRSEIAYGETLLRVAELLSPTRMMSTAPGIFSSRGRLEQRVSALIDPHRDRTTKNSRTATLAIMLSVLVATTIASTSRLALAIGDTSTVPGIVLDPTKILPNVLPDTPFNSDSPLHAGFFSGRVVGPDGKPVRGALIYIVPVTSHPISQDSVGPLRAVSGTDGQFRFLALDMIFISADGLPARRTGLVMAVSRKYGPAWSYTWGADGASIGPDNFAPQGASIELQLGAKDVPIQGSSLPTANRLQERGSASWHSSYRIVDRLAHRVRREHSPTDLGLD